MQWISKAYVRDLQDSWEFYMNSNTTSLDQKRERRQNKGKLLNPLLEFLHAGNSLMKTIQLKICTTLHMKGRMILRVRTWTQSLKPQRITPGTSNLTAFAQLDFKIAWDSLFPSIFSIFKEKVQKRSPLSAPSCLLAPSDNSSSSFTSPQTEIFSQDG